MSHNTRSWILWIGGAIILGVALFFALMHLGIDLI